jgi:hypothetical protein
VDAPFPATTRAAVTTVDSSRNSVVGSVTIRTTRATVGSRKMPAHSQVAPWKKRCMQAQATGGGLPQRDYFGR